MDEAIYAPFKAVLNQAATIGDMREESAARVAWYRFNLAHRAWVAARAGQKNTPAQS